MRALGFLAKQRFACDLGETWTIAKVDVEGSKPFSRSDARLVRGGRFASEAFGERGEALGSRVRL
jgi:hypothetical protein